MGVFDRVGGARPGYSAFDLSHRKLFTADMGQLIPVMCKSMIPGDIFKVANEVRINFQPLIRPIIHEVNCYVHYFFVPKRLLWDDWEKFITGGEDGKITLTQPVWDTYNQEAAEPGTLWDYLGFPTGQVIAPPYPVDFPKRAYNLIWNEYYRDQNFQEPIDIADNNEILNSSLEKDYFTSALHWQQRGVTPALPLTGNASAVFDMNNDIYVPSTLNVLGGHYQLASKYSGGSNIADNLQTPTHQPPNGTYNLESTLNAQQLKTWLNNNHLNLANVATFNVSDLRLAFQVQKYLERNARAGGRYIEFLKAQYGVNPKDERLQRPEYVGGSKQPVIVSEVLQTSSTDSTSPQGNYSGHAISANRTWIGRYRAEEFGIMMGILRVIPRTGYQQGINREWLYQTRYDYPNPLFVNLSEQPVYETEIFTTDNETTNKSIFGYQGRYNEMRYQASSIAGLMKTTAFASWHLNRIFDSPPNLNSQFITCNPVDYRRIFAVPSQPGMIVNVGNAIKAIRPIPYVAEPGMIDHG